MTALILIVYVLAAMRLTRLINADTITDRLRLWPAQKIRTATLRAQEAYAHARGQEASSQMDRQRRWTGVLEFIQCPWCVGMWVALATAWVPLWFSDNPIARYFAVALAASHLIGICARFADTEDIEIEDVIEE